VISLVQIIRWGRVSHSRPSRLAYILKYNIHSLEFALNNEGFTGEKTSYPNSDSYREGVVTPSGIQITSISDAQGEVRPLFSLHSTLLVTTCFVFAECRRS
jgi:hypothetical protein